MTRKREPQASTTSTVAFTSIPSVATIGWMAHRLLEMDAGFGAVRRTLGDRDGIASALTSKTDLLLDLPPSQLMQTDRWLAEHPLKLPCPYGQLGASAAPAAEMNVAVTLSASAPSPTVLAASEAPLASSPTPGQPPAVAPRAAASPWPWTKHSRWVREHKAGDTYKPGEHVPGLLALAQRIEDMHLLPELVGRIMPGLDVGTLRELAADKCACGTLELQEAVIAMHAAADRLAKPVADVNPPVERLDLEAAGAWLGRLHPVIPPGADIINLRPDDDPDRARGKAPGLPNDVAGATWKLIPRWQKEDAWASLADRAVALRLSVDAGGNVGLRLGAAADGHNLMALDLDTEVQVTQPLLRLARDFIRDLTGREAVMRFGRDGRAMLLLRCTEPLRRGGIEFEDQKVELLGQGQQIAFDGTHPSGTPYRTWPLLHQFKPDDLPELTVAEVAELLSQLEDASVLLGLTVKVKAKAAAAQPVEADVPDRKQLVGDMDEVRELMTLIESPDERYDWFKHLAAIKGATLDHPGEGLALARDWSWHDSPEEVAETERVWASINPPHLGIRELRVFAGHPAERAEDVFQSAPSAPSAPPAIDPFQAQQAGVGAAARRECGAEFLSKLDTAAITSAAKATFHQNAQPPDVLVYPLMVRGYLTLLSADGGSGKSMLMQGLTYQIASGVPFINNGKVQVHHRGKVIFLTAEENEADIAWRRDKWRERARSMTNGSADYVGQLFDGLDSAIIVPTSTEVVNLYKSGGSTEALAELESLCRRTAGLDALIIDPAGSYSTIDMNSGEQFGGFVMALRAIAARLNVALVLLHHVSKGAVNQASSTGEDMTQHAGLGSVMSVNGARVGAVMQRMSKRAAEQWGISESEAHQYVALMALKTNGIPAMIEPVWYRNDGGVLVSVTLMHRDKSAIKQAALQQAAQNDTAQLRGALLTWIDHEYKTANPPSKTALALVLSGRVQAGDKKVRAFLESELSRGVLILDDSKRSSNASHGAIRPGDVQRLRSEVRPLSQPPGDVESMFAAR